MTSQFANMTSSSNCFDVVLFLLSSLVIDPSFILISSLVLELWQFTFIRVWPEIPKSGIPVWILPNIWRLGQVRDTKFGTVISNIMLLNAAKCQGYGFYRFWVITRKPTVRDKITPPSTPRLGLSWNFLNFAMRTTLLILFCEDILQVFNHLNNTKNSAVLSIS